MNTAPQADGGIRMQVDPETCRLTVSTSHGPAKLAVLDQDGNIVPLENSIEAQLTDAVIDAVLRIAHLEITR